jgi:hypothetical protein
MEKNQLQYIIKDKPAEAGSFLFCIAFYLLIFKAKIEKMMTLSFLSKNRLREPPLDKIKNF